MHSCSTICESEALLCSFDLKRTKERYPAPRDLNEYEFFRPMMKVLAKRILVVSNTGARYRAVGGAALSLVDLCSAIILNTLVQLLLVFMVNHKMDKNHLATMTVMSLKPAFDAYRVGRKRPRQAPTTDC